MHIASWCFHIKCNQAVTKTEILSHEISERYIADAWENLSSSKLHCETAPTTWAEPNKSVYTSVSKRATERKHTLMKRSEEPT